MKAIETRYKGYRFRSRLEARWAVFFNSLNLKWEYEKEGYNLNGIYYLPDFYIPSLDCYIEIKGENPTEEEEKKAIELCKLSKKNVFIFWGGIPLEDKDFDTESAISIRYIENCDENFGWDNYYFFCECPHCNKIGIEYNGRADRIKCNCPTSSHGDKGYNYLSERLKQAYKNARCARFEWGENND